MIKKILAAIVVLLALPFLNPHFRRGFVDGFREAWNEQWPMILDRIRTK